MAAQLTAKNGPSDRCEVACSARATSTFPVPLSPEIRIVESLSRKSSMMRKILCIDADLETIPSNAGVSLDSRSSGRIMTNTRASSPPHV